MFIDSPPMVSIVAIDKEESTSIFWSGNESEVTSENEEVIPPTALLEPVDTPVIRKLRYLAEPFPRSAYRPLQFAVNGQLLTGGIASVTDSTIAIEVSEESKETNDIRTLDLREIEEVFWKGSPFA